MPFYCPQALLSSYVHCLRDVSLENKWQFRILQRNASSYDVTQSYSHSAACLRASSRWSISSCCIWPAACCRSPKPGRGCSTPDDTPWADPPNAADPPDQGSFEGGAAAWGGVCAGAMIAARRASAKTSKINLATAERYHRLHTNCTAGIAKKEIPCRKEKEKKRKDYAFRRQYNEKPSIIPGCPGIGYSVLWRCLLHPQSVLSS